MNISYFENIEGLLNKYVRKDINNLLSLGCGKLAVENTMNAKHILGIEWADEFLNISKEKAIVVKYDFKNICDILSDKSFDVVTMFDSLEHLKKEDGLKLLKELENKVKHQIIIFVPIQEKILPIDYLEKHQNEHKKNNLPLGEHLSIWGYEDFEKLGFDIIEYSPNYHKKKGYGACFCIKNL